MMSVVDSRSSRSKQVCTAPQEFPIINLFNSFRFGIYVDLESKHCSQDTDMNLCECKMALLTGRLVYRQISACKNAGTLLSALPFSSWLVPVFRLLSRFILSFSSARIDRHLALLSSKVDYSVPLCKHYRLGMQNRLRCGVLLWWRPGSTQGQIEGSGFVIVSGRTAGRTFVTSILAFDF